MRNFKKIIMLLVLVILFEQALSFMLKPASYQHYLEYDLKKMGQKEKIDLVFIGNSRVATSFNPAIFMENMDEVSYALNAGTGSQGIAGTYFYLKDILNQYDLKYVVVGLDYQTLMPEERVLKRDLIVLERIKSPLVKAEFILKSFEVEEYPYFLTTYQYKDKVWSIPGNVKKKISKEYREGIYEGEGATYENLGFTRETKVFGNYAGIYTAQPWFEDGMDAEKLGYLDKIVKLCKEKDVHLFLVSTPLTISTVHSTEGYAECVEYFKEYAEKNNIYYDNLNLLIDRETILPDAIMNCMEHVGLEGADIVSQRYSKVLDLHIKDEPVDGYFYASIEDMKEDMSDIVACALHTEKISDEGDRTIYGDCLKKDEVEVEYEFYVKKGDEVTILQEYSSAAECMLKYDVISYPMTLGIKCRSVNNLNVVRIYEVDIDERTWN